MKEYEIIKKFVLNQLTSIQQNKEIYLEKEDISKEIRTCKKLWEEITKPTFCSMVHCEESEFIHFPNDDWLTKLQQELETQFNVKLHQGVLIQGDSAHKRDTSWWSNKLKQESNNFYSQRNLNYLKRKLPLSVVQTIDTDTDNILDNLENPNTKVFDIRGMVVGHVQSGKTGNYTNLICKAVDAGYKFIVVVAGGTNILRSQTQERINNDFIGATGSEQTGVGIGNSQKLKPVSLTTIDADFNKRDATTASQGLNFETIATPVVLVIKKNTTTLTNVITWLRSQYKNGNIEHAMLMIDDESDYASIDTSKEDMDPTAINRKLREILGLFTRKSYVAYTATPYANVFINDEATHSDEKDLFPKDFIYALDAPNNYFGAEKIFTDETQKHIRVIDDYQDILPLKHNKDFEVEELPKSLIEAIHEFILNIAVRRLRGQISEHNSMLVHASRFTDIHKQISYHIQQYLESIKESISAYGGLEDAQKYDKRVRYLYSNFEKYEIDNKPLWSDILKELQQCVKKIVVREVHQGVKENKLEYKKKGNPTYAIVVGGQSLARGFTIEGLSISYFLRTTIFYDTLMQMGRWFGYRQGYEDLCQIYTTSIMVDNFCEIISATRELFEDFKVMSELKKTPKEFGLCVRTHPGSLLQVTAKNKSQSTEDFYLHMNLDGREVETSWISKIPKVNDNNIKVTLNLIETLLTHQKYEQIQKNYLWRSINKQVVIDFIKQFECYPPQQDNDSILSITTKMPIKFVKKYLEERDVVWDIAIFSGKGQPYNKIKELNIHLQQRKFQDKGEYLEVNNRQISSGNAESLSLPQTIRDEIGSDRKKAREMRKNPLLMLHFIEPNFSQTTLDQAKYIPLVGFGISFHGTPYDRSNTIKVKANSVLIRHIQEGIVEEFGE